MAIGAGFASYLGAWMIIWAMTVGHVQNVISMALPRRSLRLPSRDGSATVSRYDTPVRSAAIQTPFVREVALPSECGVGCRFDFATLADIELAGC